MADPVLKPVELIPASRNSFPAALRGSFNSSGVYLWKNLECFSFLNKRYQCKKGNGICFCCIFRSMEYQPRSYRQQFNPARFASFTVQYLETDLWIGMDHASFRKEIAEVALHEVMDLRTRLDSYIHEFPPFGASLEPLKLFPGAPPEAQEMAAACTRSGTGPMAAVAGMFALRAAEKIRKHFPLQELIVENGGDYFLLLKEELLMTIYAGDSPLSERIGILIPARETPCGVCTSSGTVGHSLSFGKADAVMVACASPVLADAWATALANRVKTPADIEPVLKYSEQFPEIRSLVIICEDKTGIRGNFEVRFIHSSA